MGGPDKRWRRKKQWPYTGVEGDDTGDKGGGGKRDWRDVDRDEDSCGKFEGWDYVVPDTDG